MVNSDNNLLNLINSVFVVYGDMKNGKGEDAYTYSVNEKNGIIAVFDGCGGSGARVYENHDNKTGAFISSHVSAETTFENFKSTPQSKLIFSRKGFDTFCNKLKKEISDSLNTIEKDSPSSSVKGTLVKPLPTTASAIYFSCDENNLNVSYVWAGDSRGYIMNKNGLVQITKDDIKGEEDAYENIKNDAVISNVICANNDFALNTRLFKCFEPGILITATDGCFNYYKTPMNFEYMLLNSLSKSKNLQDWKENIYSELHEISSDDYTMGIAIFGYDSFKQMQKDYLTRKKYLYNEYISKLDNASDDEIQSLWNAYKESYYRGA